MANRFRSRWSVSMLFVVAALPLWGRAKAQPAPANPAPADPQTEASTPPPPAPEVTPPVVEPRGKPSIDLGGFVAAQVTFDSNDAVKQNQLISVDGQGSGNGRFGGAFDATRLNLVSRLPTRGLVLEGRAEVDMQSPIYFRIRHAYASVTAGRHTLLLGQTDTLIGNWVGPNNFNNDWMFTEGNAYDRLPQLRYAFDTGRFFFAIAALPNVHGASDAIPHAQARVLVRFAQGRGLIGAASHFGYSNHVKNPALPNQEVDGVLSYLGSLDAGLSFGVVAISVQLWAGAGAAHGTGGHAIGNPLFVVSSSGAPASIPTAGGFLDLLFKLPGRFSFGVAGGTSVILDRAPGGVAVPLASNSTVVAYAAFALRPNWAFAFEAQGAMSARATIPSQPSYYEPLYNGRLLFGQRYSF